jgi:hypothetical protein
VREGDTLPDTDAVSEPVVVTVMVPVLVDVAVRVCEGVKVPVEVCDCEGVLSGVCVRVLVPVTVGDCVTAPVLDADVVTAGVDVCDAVTFCVPDLVNVTSGDGVREFVVVKDGAWLLEIVRVVVAVFEKLTVGTCEDVCDEVYVVVTAAVFEDVGEMVSVAAGVPDGVSEGVVVCEEDACGETEFETFASGEKVIDVVCASDPKTGLIVGGFVGVEPPVGLGITAGGDALGVNVFEGVTAADFDVLELAVTVLVAVGVSADESEDVAVGLNETGDFVLV